MTKRLIDENEIEIISTEITKIKSSIDAIERIFSEGTAEIKKKYRLLQKIYEEDQIISKERFDQIAVELGYDKRGAQGLFAWGGKYLNKIAGGRVALTEKAIEKLRELGLV